MSENSFIFVISFIESLLHSVMHRNTPYGVPVNYGYSDGKITEPTEKNDAMMKMIPDPFRPFHQGIAGEEFQKESSRVAVTGSREPVFDEDTCFQESGCMRIQKRDIWAAVRTSLPIMVTFHRPS